MNDDAPRIQRLLAQADLLQLLSRLFGAPSATLRRGCQHAPDDLRALLRVAGLAEELLERALLETVQLVHETPLESWVAEHSRLFECGVVCPINETAYVRRDKGPILGDVAGFYAAFGVRVAPTLHEKVDHLRCELDFCGILFTLWARALEEPSAERVEVSEAAWRSFAEDHLGEWLAGFCERLAETSGLQLYTNAAGLLELAWEALCAHHGLALRRDRPLPLVPEAGTPYECGMADSGCH